MPTGLSESVLLATNFHEWTVDQFANYTKENATELGGDYSEMIREHAIDGKIAHRLTDTDLKEMGINKVGDRLRFMDGVEKIKKIQEQKDREKVLWEGQQVLYVTCWQKCFLTCCGCCPDDPSTYKLTGTHLVVKNIEPARCGPIRCCCGTKYHIDNIDLSHVTDADVRGHPPTCCQQVCCGKAKEHIHVKRDNGEEIVLILTKDEGSNVSRKILNQVEITQRMERS